MLLLSDVICVDYPQKSHRGRFMFVFFKKIFIFNVLFFQLYQGFSAFAEDDSEVIDQDGMVIGPEIPKMNFGVVVYNSHYQIYRSGKLGEKNIEKLWEYLDEKNFKLPKNIIYMNKNVYGGLLKYAIEDYKLQTEYGYVFYHPFGLGRTYVDGVNPYIPSENIDKAENLNFESRKLFGLRNHPEHDGGVDKFYEILEFILDPKNQPVQVHCRGGMHRTGMISMAIRYLQDNEWTEPSGQIKKGRKLNWAQYEYAKFNPLFFREQNIEFIEKLSQEKRFKMLKDKYKEKLNEK
jgi:hypothetical protein